MTALVEKNTTIPTEKKQVFSTAADNQTGVTVRVFQGERKMAADNRLLGEFDLEGIPPAPRGMPKIEVKFDIDANGILNVSAKDLGTGKEANVKIQQSSGLSKDEIEKMRRDAESHADEDKQKFELATLRNQADNMCYQLEKMMKEHADKLTDADKGPLHEGDRDDPREGQGDRHRRPSRAPSSSSKPPRTPSARCSTKRAAPRRCRRRSTKAGRRSVARDQRRSPTTT